jgi:ABC-type sugar transport system ATPase subunit
MNLLDARLHGEDPLIVVSAGLSLQLPASDAVCRHRDHAVILGIRPEDIHEQRFKPSLQPLDLQVIAVEALGPEIILVGSPPGPGTPEIAARMSRDFQAPIGAIQRVYVDTDEIHLFDPATTAAIPGGPRTAPAGARDVVRSV